MEQLGLEVCDEQVVSSLTKKELQLFYRRVVRGVDGLKDHIERLFRAFTSPQATNSLGDDLIDEERLWGIWEDQKPHLKCLQDPANIQLYQVTGSVNKGGLRLPTYRCARGTTSLESFHLHMNRFIPGKFSIFHRQWNSFCFVKPRVFASFMMVLWCIFMLL